ncbi:MAG: hypothetical protein R2819_11085 [Allomuricauda sp.]
MELNYNKSALHSILKTTLYYTLWGLVFNILLFVLVWILSKWEFLLVYHNPYLNPFRGIWFWVVLGVVVGWFRRNQKNKMTFKKWSRTFIYMFFFGALIMSLQLYYVNRKHGGWNGLTGPDCVHKYQSLFLIKDRQHFINLDNCLVGQKMQKDPDYKPVNKTYTYLEDYRGKLIDYDVINPKLIWALIVFIMVGAIELLRRYGPIRVYKNIGAFVGYWKKGLSAFRQKQWELIFLGSMVNLLLLFLLPKINGLPNGKLPILFSLTILMVMFKGTIRKPKGNYFADSKNLQWFYFAVGVLVSSILLIISGNKIFYVLLVLSIGGYLYTSKLVNWSVARPVVILLLFLDVDSLFAMDDGTWPEGGLDILLNDTHGAVSTEFAAELGGTAAAVTDLAQEDPEEEEEKGGYRNPFASLQVDVDTATKAQITENATDLKERLESLKEEIESPDTQNAVDRAIEELNKVLELASGEGELSADEINKVNELMEYPNQVYKDIVGG